MEQATGMDALHVKEMNRSESLKLDDRQATHHLGSALTGRCSPDHTGATPCSLPNIALRATSSFSDPPFVRRGAFSPRSQQTTD
jgi:hypothetical protein